MTRERNFGFDSVAVWQRNAYLISFLAACLVTNVVLWMRRESFTSPVSPHASNGFSLWPLVTVMVSAVHLTSLLGPSSHDFQPSTEWNGDARTCIITDVSRELSNSVSMFAANLILFVIILGGVYQRNSGRNILSTMYREVRGVRGRLRLAFLTLYV